MDALRFERLVKRYGAVEALRGIDLQVAPGEVFGFLGPNGAGKSTAIRITLDLIRPTAGSVQVFGHDTHRASLEARRRIGYLQSDPALPSGMTATEVFEFYSSVRGGAPDRRYLERLVERLGVETARPVATLSRGNRQKVGLVLALMHQAPLIILDEPTTGLDPLVQDEVERVLREVAADGRSVFFSSHILAEVEAICSRAAIVREGLIVEAFDLQRERQLAPRRVQVRFARPPAEGVLDALPPSVSVLGRSPQAATFETRDGLDAVVRALARCEIADLLVTQPTLEELFVGYYRGDDAPAEEVTA